MPSSWGLMIRVPIGRLAVLPLLVGAACGTEGEPILGSAPQPSSPAGATATVAGQTALAAVGGSTGSAAGKASPTYIAGSSASAGGAGASALGAAGASAIGGSQSAGASAAGSAGRELGAGAGGSSGAGGSGTAGSAGTAAAGSGGAPAAIDWAARVDLGKGDGKDVVTIGDSWMAGPLNGAGIQAGLDRLGTKYRHYAVTATTLLSGQIPGQYDDAKRANPKISTVIMTGGGNDVMFTAGACSTPEACDEFSLKIVAGLDKLWTQMADDGVKDVIYIQYSDSAGSTPQENRGGTERAAVPICTTGRIYCHSIPTTDIIARSDLADGIHPGTAGNDRIAKRIAMTMEERKVRR
ncbi:MAG: hypothetical protein RL701_4137 [Pseudomonadota bacterium]